jgi:hypothetical protein
MDRRARLRRIGLLCQHCLRNLAFFRASDEARAKWEAEQFWICARNNFLDTAVLEWCKYYGDTRAKHHWRKVVTQEATFVAQLYEQLRITEALFLDYIGDMRRYRDKFLAHLDDENRMDIPNLTIAIKSTEFLYQWLVDEEDDCGAFHAEPRDAVAYFRGFFAEAQAIYAAKPVA